MTARTERPDPYRLRPSGKASRRHSRGHIPKQDVPSFASQPDLLRAGLKAMLHERLDEAKECLEALTTPEALEAREPLALDALAYLSSVRWSLGNATAAIDTAEHALELGPERFAANQKAGEMSLRLGNMELAETRFLTALRACEPGTGDAKAAEACLHETRRRIASGIRHEAKGPRLTGWLGRLIPARRQESQSAGPASPELTPLQ